MFIILGIFFTVLLIAAAAFAYLKDWPRAVYAIWAIVFVLMVSSPGSPWARAGIFPNLIFLLVWSWNLFIFAKKKEKPAFFASLLTFATTLVLVVLFKA